MEPLRRIGLVEDHEYLRDVLEQMIRMCGYEIMAFESAEGFLTAGREFDCLVVDLDLPGMTGIQLEARLRLQGLNTPVILTTGYDPMTIKAFGPTSAIAVLQKPFSLDELQAALRKAFEEMIIPPDGQPENRGDLPC